MSVDVKFMDFKLNVTDGGRDGGTDVGRSRDAIASKNWRVYVDYAVILMTAK